MGKGPMRVMIAYDGSTFADAAILASASPLLTKESERIFSFYTHNW